MECQTSKREGDEGRHRNRFLFVRQCPWRTIHLSPYLYIFPLTAHAISNAVTALPK